MKHPWMIRIFVAATMLILAAVGLILIDVQVKGGWHYWRIITVLFGLLALGLSWYLRKNNQSFSLALIWHEVLHWFFLIISMLIISVFVHVGIMGRMAASLAVLTLLSQSVFLAGIYIETTFLFIGLVLALFTVCVAFIQGYLYVIVFPLIGLIALGVLAFIAYHRRSR